MEDGAAAQHAGLQMVEEHDDAFLVCVCVCL